MPLTPTQSSEPEREGPALTAARILRPHAGYLLYTNRGPHNNLSEPAADTRRFQEAGSSMEWLVTISSRTPVMESTRHLLRMWGQLAETTTLLEVREA